MEQLFQYRPITGVTINTVWLSPAFREALLWVLAASFGAALIVLAARKRSLLQSFRLAAVAAFFCGGILYAFQADIGWGSWVATDYRTFGGKTTDGKVLAMEGLLYEFVLRSREVLHSDFHVTDDGSDNYAAKRFEYFMLPLRHRPVAENIVVIGDRAARFDPATGTFSRGDLVVQKARPLLVFLQDAYIVQRPKERP